MPAPAASADEVAAQLVMLVPAAAAGTQIRSLEVVFWVAVADAEEALAATRAAAAELRSRGYPVDPARVVSRPAVPETEWRDAWKKYFHVTRITRQIVIVPSWESFTPGPDDIAIDLDPGQAFGTGAHDTTRLVLERMQQLADDGLVVSRFADIGAGSGILSIAAARLWPNATGVAVDNDELAVDACRENCTDNRVGERVDVSLAPLSPALEPFDLVLANIRSDVLIDLVDEIAPRVGGALVLSGLYRDQTQQVIATYQERGLRLVACEAGADGNWSAAHMVR